MGYPAGGNENMGYPAGGNENMGYPAPGEFLSLPPTPSTNTGVSPGGNTAAPLPSLVPGGGPSIVTPPPGGYVGASQGQGTAAPIPPVGASQPGNPSQPAGASPPASPVPPGGSYVAPATNAASSCWCGCDATCSNTCDLCNSSPTGNYENISGVLQPTNTG